MLQLFIVGLLLNSLTLASSDVDEGSGSGSGSGDDISPTEPGDNSTDACEGNPCKNNATCINLEDDYKCNCTEGFTGKTCNVSDACRGKPCQNGATCVLFNNGFSCTCPVGFTGRACSIRDNGNRQLQSSTDDETKKDRQIVLTLVSVGIGVAVVAILISVGILVFIVRRF